LSKGPLVSVIMNCYNGALYLNAAIDSVLAQSYPNWELIFWDNKSSDGSADKVRCYNDPRIKYFYASKHTLLYEARSYAVQKSSGELLAFLDVDDIWLPDKLELQTILFADPEVGFVYGNYWVESELKDRRWLAHSRPLPDGRILDKLLKFYFVGLLTLVIRRLALDSLEYHFDTRYRIIGDLDLVIRLSIGWKAGRIKEPVAIYRMHGNNESTVNRDRHADELKQWSNENKENEAIRSSSNFHFIKSNFVYIKAMNFALQGNKRGVYALLREVPWGLIKIRLLAAFILPTRVIKLLKN
jgi:glycosyltransferase involved in cell wall biosynthesis